MTEPLLRVYFKLAKSFLMIGSVSFGGYLPMVAMVRERLVVRDKVLDDVKITEGLALSSLLPGPLAVNVVAYIGYSMAGFFGAAVSMVAVLLPSFLLVLGASYMYFSFDSHVDVDLVMMGVFPIVLSIIFALAFNTFQRDCSHGPTRLIAIASFLLLLFFPGYGTIVGVILISGFIGFLLGVPDNSKGLPDSTHRTWILLLPIVSVLLLMLIVRVVGTQNILLELFNEFAGASLTLFGGGYVMIPVLKTLLVDNLSWVTEKEFLFAISIGQVTPGPILISTVFFGYKVGGIIGSLAAVCGIFLPSSLLMIFCSHFYEKLSSNWQLKAALSGIKPAIVGLILYSGVSLFLSDQLFESRWYLAALTSAGIILLEGFKWSSLKLALAGFALGLLLLLINNI